MLKRLIYIYFPSPEKSHTHKNKLVWIKKAILMFPAICSFMEFLLLDRHYIRSRDGEQNQKHLPSITELTV